MYAVGLLSSPYISRCKANKRHRDSELTVEDSVIVLRLRSIIKEQLSDVERKQVAYFLIENANLMAHFTRKPVDEALTSVAIGEQTTGVMARRCAGLRSGLFRSDRGGLPSVREPRD